jgi:hypothetical protein
MPVGGFSACDDTVLVGCFSFFPCEKDTDLIRRFVLLYVLYPDWIQSDPIVQNTVPVPGRLPVLVSTKLL